MTREFVDEVTLRVRGGDGGNGVVSFHREKYRPKGGPDGGNGGDGGSVILRVDPNQATLAELSRNPHQRAGRGTHGSGNNRHGAAGDDRLLLVPDGTVVLEEDGVVRADLVGAGAEVVAARGGRGGRGNAAFAGARRKAPGFAERGEAGEERRLRLELKVLADVGLVGFPNAGKSSLIARLTRARPAVAGYPFTTLTPHLGVAETGDGRFVVADVPGLIEGASEGRGLGLRFLRHLERCALLCFVLDLAAGDPAEMLAALRAELEAYRPGFAARPGLVGGNKIDLPGARDAIEPARAAAEAAGLGFAAVSALTGEGIEELSARIGALVTEARAARPALSHRLVRIRPESEEVLVEREDAAWRVRSAGAERLVRRFDLDNPEAVAHVQGRLVEMGVENALARAGARAGDEVRIGEAAFEFIPEREPSEGKG